MKFRLAAALVLLAVVVSAFNFDTKDSRRVYKKNYQSNFAHHQRRRVEAARSKNYAPTFPADPISISLTIGESKQHFDVAFTSSSDTLWVLDVSYPEVGPYVTTFDPSHSSAIEVGEFYQETDYNIVEGKTYSDVVTIVNPSNQTFGSVFYMQTSWDDPKFDSHISGVYGFSWDPKLKDERITVNSSSIFHLFAASPDLPRLISLAAGSDRSGILDYSVVKFGKSLNGYCQADPLVTLPLTYSGENKLTFEMKAFWFGDQKTNGDLSSIDPGLPLIYVAYEAYAIIESVIQPEYDYDLELEITSCKNRDLLDDFAFNVDGGRLHIPAFLYIIDVGLGDDRCVLAVELTSDYMTPYVFGSPLLFSYCAEWSIDDTTIQFKHYTNTFTDTRRTSTNV
ncbi:Peptidase A1 domain-containing protein [Aphelenchoides besseyi]|nr:Peptidase A1 domain-containing protein [Aphelenchoides besseyi]